MCEKHVFFAAQAGFGAEQTKPEPRVGFNTGENLFCFLFSYPIIVGLKPIIHYSPCEGVYYPLQHVTVIAGTIQTNRTWYIELCESDEAVYSIVDLVYLCELVQRLLAVRTPPNP